MGVNLHVHLQSMEEEKGLHAAEIGSEDDRGFDS